MKHSLVNISGMILLIIVVSIAMLALIHVLQAAGLPSALATVSWNG